MKVRFRIQRFDPSKDEKPYYQVYECEAEPTDRVLDCLQRIKGHMDGSLTFRRSCAHGICGSDAMTINGLNRLACKTLIKEVGKEITVEPLRGFPVVKDLAVETDGFLAKYRAVKPYLINEEPVPEKERLQRPEDRQRFEDTSKCILCMACTSACPSYWENPEFLGPAAIVNAHRFLFDSRDRGAQERLDVLNTRNGVWRCRTIFNCNEACPRSIDITKAISEVKRALLFRRL
jgi:succinate dehydrogenase / fumarate reductase iron-sulfur subunit